METTLIKIDTPELQSIEPSKAEMIKKTFEPMAKMLSEFEESFNQVVTESETGITKEITVKAKRLRLDISKVRIQTGKLKDEQKAEYLRAGNAIQGVHNLLVWAVTDKENKLKEIEDYFEIQEKKRLDALQGERATILSEFVDDAFERNLSGMEEDVWNAYLSAKKKEHTDKIEAEKIAEAERIENERLNNIENQRRLEIAHYAQFVTSNEDLRNMSEEDYQKLMSSLKTAKIEHDKEQARIREENEKLKKQQEAERIKAEKEREEREKAEAERIAKEEKERLFREQQAKKEREAYEAKLKAEREERAKAEAEERAKRERIESELRAKQEAERIAKEQEEARIQSELNKGDADKVKDLINDLELLKTKYSFKSKKNQKMYSDFGILIDKVINHIQK